MTPTYLRINQAYLDWLHHKLGGEPTPGGYPVNPPDEETARSAGFQRGYYAAYQECVRRSLPVTEYIWPETPEASEQGFCDGWNAVVERLND